MIGIGVGSVEAVACTCDLPPPHKSQRQLITSARNSSQAVFSGVVLKTDEVGISLVRVTLKVDAFWKGPLPSNVIVTTGSGRGDCGYQFTVGHRYLVYAYGSDLTDLDTNICHRTALYKHAAADLKVLGKAKRPA